MLLGSQDGGIGPERAWELECRRGQGDGWWAKSCGLGLEGRAGPSVGAGQRPTLAPSQQGLLSAIPTCSCSWSWGEVLGVVVVESGWDSILPTVILAKHDEWRPDRPLGKLSIGDQIMSINGTSLVGLPLATCQGIIKVGTGPLTLPLMLCNPH